MSVEKIVQLVSELPPNLQQEVEDFVEFLIKKNQKQSAHPPSFAWVGSLCEMREEYSSVELQHQISQWRIDDSEGSSK